MPRMNNHTKLVFALEHIAHLEDLFEDYSDGALLAASLRAIKTQKKGNYEEIV